MAATAHVYVLPDQTVYQGGKIYDRFGNLEYFADVSALSDEAASGGTDVVSEVKAHTRLPYMNSKAAISIPKHDRNVMTGVRQSKGALPGKRFTLVTALEKRDFTTTARMSAVYAWLKTTAKLDVTMYSEGGTPYDPIKAVENAG